MCTCIEYVNMSYVRSVGVLAVVIIHLHLSVRVVPAVKDARVVAPPRVDLLDHVWPRVRLVQAVSHGAQSAPKLRVEERAGALPAEVAVVEVVVEVESVQVRGEFARRLEVVDVDE